jgi:IS4 transposase
VELFFKLIEQQLRIKQFYETPENAVKTLRWIAMSVYIFVAIVYKGLRLEASLYIDAGPSVTIFKKTIQTAYPQGHPNAILQ